MSDAEDRILDLALEEVFSSRSRDGESGRIDAILRRIEARRSNLEAAGRARTPAGRRMAAIAASVLSLILASWFLLGRFGPPSEGAPPGQELGTAANRRLWQDEASRNEVQQLVDKLSDPDSAVRDQASQALKRKGPELLDLLREQLGRVQGAEARARLQDLITYWTHAVAARVDGETVTWEVVDSCLKDIRPSDISQELRRDMLRRIVEERTFLHEARRRGIVIPEEELREAARRNVEAAGGDASHREMLRAKRMTLEDEWEQLRRQLSIQKVYPRILEEAGANPGADPFKLDLNETSREELRRWYDAHPDKFAAVDRVEVFWVELRFEAEKDKAAKKTLAEAIVAKMQTRTQAKNNLGWACYELGVKENLHVSGFDRGEQPRGPFGEETKKLLFDSFKFGEARLIDEGTSSFFVLQLYDRARRVSETFEQAEPNIRAMFENQRLETNRKRIREGLRERARITPVDLFEDK